MGADLAINRAQHGMGGAWPCFAWRVLDSGSAWHGWSLAMLRLEGAGFWPSMAWVEPGHASLGGCWILAQHGMGGAWPCFAWRVLARCSDRSDLRPRHEPATFQFAGRGPAGSWPFSILVQHGMGETWPCFAWGVGFWLSMAWVEPGHASLGGCWHGAQIAPTPGHVTSQLPGSRPRPCWELAVLRDGPES